MKDGRATRQRIHDAALRLFVAKGGETSVRDLAQAAGIAEGTLYRHYASKDDLVADLFAGNYAAFARRLAELQQPLAGFRARLDAVVAEVFRFDERLRAAYAGEGAFDLQAVLEDAYARRPVWNCETAQWVRMVPQTGDIRAWVRA